MIKKLTAKASSVDANAEFKAVYNKIDRGGKIKCKPEIYFFNGKVAKITTVVVKMG